MSRRTRVMAAATLAVALATTTATAPSYADPNNNTVRKLTQAVTVDGVMEHLEAFQAIADANGGDRAAGRSGYRASVDYVVDQLEKAGYDPTVQDFQFTYSEENSELERISPDPRTFVQNTEFLRNAFDSGTPKGEATGTMFVIPAADATDGCEPGDFTGMTSGQVALIQRGGCGFAIKALAAQAAGAGAAIIYNNTAGMINMIGDATGLTIPVVFASQVVGEGLATTPGALMRVKVDYFAEERTTWNVIAETKAGNDDNVVMAGAHLDGVQEGPGINDNGSGSASLLETAIQMSKVKPTNTVRFAWWGAEEDGLLGSEHYVGALTEAEAEDIALYLNFDMVASPNYMFGIYDGDNSGGTAAPGFIPPGSAEIEDVFEKYYADRGEPSQDSEFSGRSDYGPFIAVGIPAGGLFTGAEVPKTAAEAALYGGVAGASYDPCYHAFCDNLTGAGQNVALYDQLREDYELRGNINVHALDVNSDAVATAVLTFAYDTSTVNDVPGHPGRGQVKSGQAQEVLQQARDQHAR